MRLNFENNKLVTAGVDGVVTIFSCLDKEPKKKTGDGKESTALPAIGLSDEILIEKDKRDKLQGDI
jgi:hypothetical protein